MKLSDYVMSFLAQQGVKHVFMVPGGGAMHLNNSLGENPYLTYVNNLHEQASAIAAEAYARVSGKLGVAMVTTGPGGTNAITGLLGAWIDSTPCLFISGQVKRPDLMKGLGVRQMGVQEADIVSMVQPITKYAVTVMDPSEIRFHMEKATYIARSGRPGPVWVDIPLDIQAAEIDPDQLVGFEPPVDQPRFDQNDLNLKVSEAIKLLNQASRPVLLAGNGIRVAGAQDEFLAMVEALGIPVLTTRLGVDLIPADHPLSMGMPGSIASRGANFTLQNSDLLLVIGARLDLAIVAFAYDRLARAACKIVVDIDPAEIAKIRTRIDLPITSDAKLFIESMISQREAIAPVDRSAWLSRCREWKAKYPFVLPEHHQSQANISLYAFSDILSDELTDKDVVLPGNSGFAAEIFLTAFKVKMGQRVFHNKGTGAMGFCQPAAIGACLAGDRRRTVCVDGDGGFQLNIQELETVKRLDLPVKFFVINNQGYASIRASQQGYFGHLTGADPSSGLTFPDLVKIGEAYGIRSVRLADPSDLRKVVCEVLAYPGPVICDVVVIPDEPRAPRVASMQKPDGSMVSKPLEDMWPFLDRDEFLSNMYVPPLDE